VLNARPNNQQTFGVVANGMTSLNTLNSAQ
jgi:hypothetical protein